ncbi:uncharacterized protein TNCV_596311 [Trichonephila clavipes]|nr:uncharacterized protein TNCV_596311 [Trichonephila clavipes]
MIDAFPMEVSTHFVITAEIESGFVAKDDLFPFHCSPLSSCVGGTTSNQGVNGTGAPSEGAICAWMATDEAVGCTRAFLRMRWSSRRLVCQGHPEPGLRVNYISRIHWSQHLLTTQSSRPN